MGKQKNAPKGVGKAPSGHSPTLSSHLGEAGDPCDVVQDLSNEAASLEVIPDGHFFPNTLLIYTMWWIAVGVVLIIGASS